jgi:cyanophycinase
VTASRGAAGGSAPVRRLSQGPVLPIGGAEDLTGDGPILTRFVTLAGGNRARIAVVPTASDDPERTGAGYAGLFRELGAAEADWLRIGQRPDANAEPALGLLRGATGIFVTGGDQARLVALLIGTLATECIRTRNAAGVVVAGTSAGASILPAHLMSGETRLPGGADDAAARRGAVDLVAGFGLLPDTIVDQHFSQRGRLGRLLSAFAANPGLVGIGLDEDTAVLIGRDGTLEVLGSGMVTVVDGRNATSDYFDRAVGEVLTVVDSSLFVLGPGRRFDLASRRPLPA